MEFWQRDRIIQRYAITKCTLASVLGAIKNKYGQRVSGRVSGERGARDKAWIWVIGRIVFARMTVGCVAFDYIQTTALQYNTTFYTCEPLKDSF